MSYDFETQFAGFMLAAEAKVNKEQEENHPTLHYRTKLWFQRGQKNIRVITRHVNKKTGEEDAFSDSVYVFIEIGTGEILKPAGWKAPAKHSRGTIMTDTFGVEYVTSYGASYLL